MAQNINISDSILLSICIPTYNRAKYLSICLECIFSQIDINDRVEVIVSDNCSSDETIKVIDQYKNHPCLKVIRQVKNVGPMRNGAELVSNYAKGKFCWYVGDDDYIMLGAISNILNLIAQNPQTEFFYVDIENHEIDKNKVSLAETFLYIKSKDKVSRLEYIFLEKFENVLSPKYSDLFLGEMMACIFKRELWLNESISPYLDLEYLSTLETSYLHCVVFANQFMGCNAIYVSTPVIFVDNRAREWSAKASYILVEHLYTLLFLYKKNGLSDKLFRICAMHYMKLTLPVVFKFLVSPGNIYRNKISFYRYFKFLLLNPTLFIQTILTRVFIKIFRFIS